MKTHKVHLVRTNKGGKCRMAYNGRLLGVSKTPLFSAARKLLQLELAQPEDRIEAYRDNILSMAGPVGAAARLTVDESAGSGTPRFAIWKPFPSRRFAR